MPSVSASGTCVICGCDDVKTAATITSCPDCGWDGALDGSLSDGEDGRSYAVFDSRPVRLTPFFADRTVAAMVMGRLDDVTDLDLYLRPSDRDGL